MTWNEIARLRSGRVFGMSNGGWPYDAYPALEPLNAGRAITVAGIEGPAVITHIHFTQHLVVAEQLERYGLSQDEGKAASARGVILEIYFDDGPAPAVRVPLGDFFADGCGGQAVHFSTPFVEKAPESYNCFIPMPFAKSARVVLRNDTPYDLVNYSFVEYERLPAWEEDLGYFHATWRRFAFALDGETDLPFFHVDGRGHLLGRAWSIATDEPYFRRFHFVMEANNEVRVDGEEEPRADYLGTEDSFGFSWGFREPFAGLHNGINFVQAETPSLLSIYRFRDQNVLRFNKSLDWRLDWSHEFKWDAGIQRELVRLHDAGRGWIDYATTYYWYQEMPGYEHEALLPLAERIKTVLHPNPL